MTALLDLIERNDPVLCLYIVAILYLGTGCLASPSNSSTAPAAPSAQADPHEQSMVRVPADTFQIGLTREQAEELCEGISPETRECIPDDLLEQAPAHRVTIAGDFWIDIYEVTNQQYQACVLGGVCTSPVQTWIQGYPTYYTDPQFARHPVVHITFEQAEVYCSTWRSGRLPAEVEWEYAARGTDGRLWPWGNELDDPATLANLMTLESATGGYGRRLQAVGSFIRDMSPFGVYDMAGNVMEWAQPEPPASDTGTVQSSMAAVRGGYSLDFFFNASTSTRHEREIDEAGAYIGFRCVGDVDE